MRHRSEDAEETQCERDGGAEHGQQAEVAVGAVHALGGLSGVVAERV